MYIIEQNIVKERIRQWAKENLIYHALKIEDQGRFAQSVLGWV